MRDKTFKPITVILFIRIRYTSKSSNSVRQQNGAKIQKLVGSNIWIFSRCKNTICHTFYYFIKKVQVDIKWILNFIVLGE